jgi:hypothetical protein
MIDLETLSTNPNAVILTVGGVKFNPYNSEEPAQPMYFPSGCGFTDCNGQRRHAGNTGLVGHTTQRDLRRSTGRTNRISLEEMINH